MVDAFGSLAPGWQTFFRQGGGVVTDQEAQQAWDAYNQDMSWRIGREQEGYGEQAKQIAMDRDKAVAAQLTAAGVDNWAGFNAAVIKDLNPSFYTDPTARWPLS